MAEDDDDDEEAYQPDEQQQAPVEELDDEVSHGDNGLGCFNWCGHWGEAACWTHAALCGGCESCLSGEMVDESVQRECAPFVTSDANSLHVNGRKLFLNGVNLAWIEYGKDFLQYGLDGADFYCGVEKAMRAVRSNGGNAMRVWLFTEPKNQLVWTDGGEVQGMAPGVVIMTQTLLELAAHYDVRIVLVLFNGAVVHGREACSMFEDEDVLDSLVANVVRPLAMALNGYEHLAMWEVINEPEGILETPTSERDDRAHHCVSIWRPT
eukprot:7383257-Prymnesium_polylepis.1